MTTNQRVSTLVTQVAHGFVRGTPVRFDGSDWVLAVAGDSGIGLVGNVTSSSAFEYVTNGFLDGLDGMVGGQLYYVNADGELDTDTSGSLIFRAYTATSGWVLTAGTEAVASESTTPAGASVASVTALSDDLAAHLADLDASHPAVSISYENTAYPTLADVQAALDSLLFFDMTATMSGGYTAETGASIATLDLTWSFNKDISAQALTGTGVVVPALADRTQTVTGPFTTDTTWTIQGTSLDATETPTATTTLVFKSMRYWGVSSSATLVDADILALAGSEFATNLVQSRELTPVAQYLYFAWPTSFGTPEFTVNGLLTTSWSLVRDTSTFVNASGGSVAYDVWRSDNLLTSTYDVDVAVGTSTWIAVSETNPVFAGITWNKNIPARAGCLLRNSSDANHYRFEVGPGDICVSVDGPTGGGKERCELSGVNGPLSYLTAYTITYQMRVYTPGAKDPASAGWAYYGQLHATPDGGDAAVGPCYGRELGVSTRQLRNSRRTSEVNPIVTNPSPTYMYSDGGINWNRWVDVTEEHYISPSTTAGYHRVYHDGVLVANYSGKTGYVDAVGPYYKIGIYRAEDATNTFVAEFRNFAISP